MVLRGKNTREAFTLVELAVVLALITLVTSTVLLRLGGLTDRARLRAGTIQVESTVRQAHSLARSDGRPRLVVYDRELSQIAMRAPQRREGRWSWDEGLATPLPSGVRISAVFRPEEQASDEVPTETESISVRFDAAQAPAHAVLLERGAQMALVWSAVDGRTEVTFPTVRPQALTLETLRAELRP